MTPWDLLWSHLLWSGEPRSVTVGSLEWEREFAGGTIAHRIVLDRTEGEISNRDPLLMRVVCHAILDQIPEQGLTESWQKLKQIRDFHLEAATWNQKSLPQPRKAVKARIGKTYERPQVRLPETER